jgi:hypothetical protein
MTETYSLSKCHSGVRDSERWVLFTLILTHACEGEGILVVARPLNGEERLFLTSWRLDKKTLRNNIMPISKRRTGLPGSESE